MKFSKALSGGHNKCNKKTNVLRENNKKLQKHNYFKHEFKSLVLGCIQKVVFLPDFTQKREIFRKFKTKTYQRLLISIDRHIITPVIDKIIFALCMILILCTVHKIFLEVVYH